MLHISFYALTKTPLEKAVPKLVDQLYHGGKKVLILCADVSQMHSLDTLLWTFSSGSFIPHGFTGDPLRHPVWLQTGPLTQNPNEASVALVLSGDTLKEGFVEKGADFFDGYDSFSSAKARDRMKVYRDQGHTVTFWEQTGDGGAWACC